MLEVQARIYGSNGGSFNGPAGTNKLKWGYSSSVSDEDIDTGSSDGGIGLAYSDGSNMVMGF